MFERIKKFFSYKVPNPLENHGKQEGRGINTYSPYQLITVSAKGKDDKYHDVTLDPIWTETDPLTRLLIYQKCVPVFSVVTGQANKISALEWKVESVKTDEDEIVQRLKDSASIYRELKPFVLKSDGDINQYYFHRCVELLRDLSGYLDDLLPDLSNFQTCLYRFKKKLDSRQYEKCREIENYIRFPNSGELWTDFVKKAVQDLMIHGRLALYKKEGNFWVLPGGDIYPVKTQFVSSIDQYVQLSNYLDPQLYFPDEVAFATYMPNSGTNNGMIPLDSLLNLVAAELNYEQWMAEYSDGDTYPQKILAFGQDSPQFDPIALSGKDIINKDEQARIKYALNERKKDNAIQILTGYGTPTVLDLSREQVFPELRSYRDLIDKSVAMVFNLSNNEINQTGANGTSGRSTSEVQQQTDNSKNTKALTEIISQLLSYEVIPSKFGFGYHIKFIAPVSEEEKINQAKLKSDSGLWTKNEIRLELGLDPIAGEENEILGQGQPTQPTQPQEGI